MCRLKDTFDYNELMLSSIRGLVMLLNLRTYYYETSIDMANLMIRIKFRRYRAQDFIINPFFDINTGKFVVEEVPISLVPEPFYFINHV